jgi:hypothetical protein
VLSHAVLLSLTAGDPGFLPTESSANMAARGMPAFDGRLPGKQSLPVTSDSREGTGMGRKILGAMVPVVLTLLVASTWDDLIRFVKIKRMDAGRGHPEFVPAEGRKAYPQRPGGGTPDGTGEFDSAQRGGPIHAD